MVYMANFVVCFLILGGVIVAKQLFQSMLMLAKSNDAIDTANATSKSKLEVYQDYHKQYKALSAAGKWADANEKLELANKALSEAWQSSVTTFALIEECIVND